MAPDVADQDDLNITERLKNAQVLRNSMAQSPGPCTTTTPRGRAWLKGSANLTSEWPKQDAQEDAPCLYGLTCASTRDPNRNRHSHPHSPARANKPHWQQTKKAILGRTPTANSSTNAPYAPSTAATMAIPSGSARSGSGRLQLSCFQLLMTLEPPCKAFGILAGSRLVLHGSTLALPAGHKGQA